MNSSKTARFLKHGVIAGIAIYATSQVRQGMDTLSEGFRKLEDAHAEGLNLGMQLIMMLLILYLCFLAAQNIWGIIILCKEPVQAMVKVQIILGFLPALTIFILLFSIALYGMYMAYAGRAGKGMYAAGVFFIIVAGWGISVLLRKFMGLLKGKQQENE